MSVLVNIDYEAYQTFTGLAMLQIGSIKAIKLYYGLDIISLFFYYFNNFFSSFMYFAWLALNFYFCCAILYPFDYY
jgi:hypothetical protein